jgi:hypothetical protein
MFDCHARDEFKIPKLYVNCSRRARPGLMQHALRSYVIYGGVRFFRHEISHINICVPMLGGSLALRLRMEETASRYGG